MDDNEAATRDSFPTRDVPCEWEALDLGLYFEERDFDRVRRGFIPEPGEPWFLFYEDGWLHVHRAHSGLCFARLRFESQEGRLIATTTWLRKGAHLGYQPT